MTSPTNRPRGKAHYSDCALHNGPALKPEQCSCGVDPDMTPEKYGSEFPKASGVQNTKNKPTTNRPSAERLKELKELASRAGLGFFEFHDVASELLAEIDVLHAELDLLQSSYNILGRTEEMLRKDLLKERDALREQVRGLSAALRKLAAQNTPEEFEELENEVCDDEVLAEAYEFMVLDARAALAKYGAKERA